MRYYPHIDGLRSLAVLPVVLFHAGVPLFTGGYVGVDVFFVISGYLITAIILRELQENRFSIVKFYERRLRRIFPALAVMLAFVALTAPAFLLPSELRDLPKELFGTLAFVANIVFWRDSGYFGAAAEEKPLLHMWSLGIEEQYYIFAPLALMLILRSAPQFTRHIMSAVLAVSLLGCVWLTGRDQSMSFYLLPTRAWELLAGALLATNLPRFAEGRITQLLAWAGLALLCLAIFTFDKRTIFPGAAAIVPVLGASLILYTGPNTTVARLLSRRPLVVIGLFSYSLYLWHWPFTVYFRDLFWLEMWQGKAAVVGLSLLVAWASWRYIETPFRDPSRWPARRLGTWAGAVWVGLVALSLGLHLTDGWPQRFSPEAQRFDAARKDISPERLRCHFSEGLPDPQRWCRLGSDRPTVALWSDSHGVELAAALAQAGLPLLQASYSACPPAVGYQAKNRPECATHNQQVLDHILATAELETVVMIGNYRAYDATMFAALSDTITTLQEAGRRVVMLDQTPSPGTDVPSLLAAGHGAPFAPQDAEMLLGIIPEGVPVLSMRGLLCPDGLCPLVINTMPLLFDSHHLSMTAARSIAPQLQRCIKEIGLAPRNALPSGCAMSPSSK